MGKIFNTGRGDEVTSLGEHLDNIKKLIDKYGSESLIKFDAGYNNVSMYIDTRKKSISDYEKYMKGRAGCT